MRCNILFHITRITGKVGNIVNFRAEQDFGLKTETETRWTQ